MRQQVGEKSLWGAGQAHMYFWCMVAEGLDDNLRMGRGEKRLSLAALQQHSSWIRICKLHASWQVNDKTQVVVVW